MAYALCHSMPMIKFKHKVPTAMDWADFAKSDLAREKHWEDLVQQSGKVQN